MPSAEVASLAKLKAQGWHLSEEGLELCKEEFREAGRSKRDDGRTPSVDEILSIAKNMDLKVIGSAFLADHVKSKAPSDQASAQGAGPTSVILQIQKMRNISAPKINENSNAAPRMLRLNLTDGFTTILGLEIEHVPSLNLDLPPGTKVRVKLPPKNNVHADPSVPGGFVNNYLLLGPGVISAVGGRVPDLAEKWELMKTVTGQNRLQIMAGDSEGPPPWVPFGTKNPASNNAGKNLKTTGGSSRESKPSGEANAAAQSGNSSANQEFEDQRRANIAEAAAKAAKKPSDGGSARPGQASDVEKREEPKGGAKKGTISPTGMKPEPAMNGTNGPKVAGSDSQNAASSKPSQPKRDGPQEQGKLTTQGPENKKPQGGSPPAPSPTGGSSGGGDNREPKGRTSPDSYPAPYGRQRGPQPDSRRGGRGGPSGPPMGHQPGPGGPMGWGNPRPFPNAPPSNFNQQVPHFSGATRVVTNSNARRGGITGGGGGGPSGPGYATGPPGSGYGRGRYGYPEEDEGGDPRRRGPINPSIPSVGASGGRPGGPPQGMGGAQGGPGYHQQWEPNKAPQRFNQGEPHGNHTPGPGDNQKQEGPDNRGGPLKKPGEGPPVQAPPLLPHPNATAKQPLLGHEPPRDFGGPVPKLHPNPYQPSHHGMPQQFPHAHVPPQGQQPPQHQGQLLPKPNMGTALQGGPGQQPIPHGGPPNALKPSPVPVPAPLLPQQQGPGGAELRSGNDNLPGPGRSPRPSPDHVGGQPGPNQGRAGTPGSGPPSLGMQPQMASFPLGQQQPPHGPQHPQMPVPQQQGPPQHVPPNHQTPSLMGPPQQQPNHFQGGVPGGFRPPGSSGPPLVASPGLQQPVTSQMHSAAAVAASMAQQQANVNALQQQFQHMGLVRGTDNQSPGPPMNQFGGGPPQQPPTPQQFLQQQQQQRMFSQQQQSHHMQAKLASGMPAPPGFQAQAVAHQSHQQAAGIPFFTHIPGFVPQAQAQNPGAAPAGFPIHPSLLQTQQIQQIINAMAMASAVRPALKIGDFIMARYWEDKEFYRAQIVDFTERGYKVHFIDYGNTEEVGMADIYGNMAPGMAPVADPNAMAAAMAAALSAQSPPPTAPSPYRYY